MSSSGTSDSYDYMLEYPEINKFKFQENEDFHVFDVNAFKKIKTLGSGKFVVKHYEYIPRENFPIAIKIIPIHNGNQENRLKLLIREIENLKKVATHPNIIDFYGLCLYNEEAWICMELMDMTLHEFYLKTHQYYNIFPESILGCIVVKIIDALQYCKSKGIIHRDLKPQNILIKKTGEIKLCDFGESRVLKDSIAITYVGTIAYWPPERFIYAKNNSNEPSTPSSTQNDYDFRYDIRSDIWSLGITLVEVVYGKLPYKALNEPIDNYIILQDKIRDINGHELIKLCCQDNCSNELRLFITVCLSQIDERPRSYDELQKLEFYELYKKLEGIQIINPFFHDLQEKENLVNINGQTIQKSILTNPDFIALLLFCATVFTLLSILILSHFIAKPDPSPPCPSHCEISCPDSWVYNSKTGFCYKVFYNVTFISYDDAELICVKYNGSLASIHSGDENSFILGLHNNVPYIGLRYNNKTNAFQWSDNTIVNYTNFGHKNTSTGDYCVSQELGNGMWYTRVCSYAEGFVCKARPQIWQNNALEYKIKDTAFLNIIEGNNQTKPINSYSEQDQCSNTCPTCVPDSCTPCPCNTKCPDGWTYYSATNFCYKIDHNWLPFSSAEQTCQQSNSHLISVLYRLQRLQLQAVNGY